MKKIILPLLISFSSSIYAQTELVFVFFKDKPNKASFYANPLSELTQKSLDRRTNLGIPLNDQDAPLETLYVQNIQNLGFTVTDMSKWLNGVAVNATSEQIVQLSQLDFVQNVESFVKNPDGGKRSGESQKFADFKDLKSDFNYGTSDQQVNQINLKPLHEAGYTGNGVTIAMLDTGYPTVNTGSAFARLRNAGKIKGGYNFLHKNNNLYNNSFNAHGTICLGAIAGYLENQFVGTGPDVDVYLYVTESGPLEIPEEELYWIQAAEDADRKGVDIISASLGYTNGFDDSRYDYTYEDMTGSRSFVARGAQIAAEKGILVFAANGNEGNSSWHYLGTPADNPKVFSIGAVDINGNPSSFTSYGPNFLGAIKPDAAAKGTEAATVLNHSVTYVSGTSIATPIAAGAVASFLQFLPSNKNRDEIKNLLRNTASLAPSYDDQLGYGILNLGLAYTQSLAASDLNKAKGIQVFPNPSSGQFFIKAESNGTYEIYDFIGRKITSNIFTKGLNEASVKLTSGNYFIQFQTTDGKKDAQKITIK